eukprot:344568-Pleurochrysis_carterae.AAC.2
MGRSNGLALRRAEVAIAVIRLIVRKVSSAAFSAPTILTVIGRSSVFRIQRIAGQFSFALSDSQLAL